MSRRLKRHADLPIGWRFVELALAAARALAMGRTGELTFACCSILHLASKIPDDAPIDRTLLRNLKEYRQKLLRLLDAAAGRPAVVDVPVVKPR